MPSEQRCERFAELDRLIAAERRYRCPTARGSARGPYAKRKADRLKRQEEEMRQRPEGKLTLARREWTKRGWETRRNREAAVRGLAELWGKP